MSDKVPILEGGSNFQWIHPYRYDEDEFGHIRVTVEPPELFVAHDLVDKINEAINKERVRKSINGWAVKQAMHGDLAEYITDNVSIINDKPMIGLAECLKAIEMAIEDHIDYQDKVRDSD